jgi:hypothetical protein
MSSNVHDPLGLMAMPVAPMSAGLDNPAVGNPKLATEGAQSAGVSTSVKTIGGALITLLVVVSLVAPPGPATESSVPRTGISKSYAGWCPRFTSGLVSETRNPIRELLDRALILQR